MQFRNDVECNLERNKFSELAGWILMKFATQNLQSAASECAKLHRPITKFRNKQDAEIESCNEQVPSYVKYLEM